MSNPSRPEAGRITAPTWAFAEATSASHIAEQHRDGVAVLAPSLGVSSLDLGRSQGRPFFLHGSARRQAGGDLCLVGAKEKAPPKKHPFSPHGFYATACPSPMERPLQRPINRLLAALASGAFRRIQTVGSLQELAGAADCPRIMPRRLGAEHDIEVVWMMRVVHHGVRSDQRSRWRAGGRNAQRDASAARAPRHSRKFGRSGG